MSQEHRPYQIVTTRAAERGLKNLPGKERERILTKIRSLADAPRSPGVEKLTDSDLYRLRSGNYRVIYSIEDTRRIITIESIGDRRDIYKH